MRRAILGTLVLAVSACAPADDSNSSQLLAAGVTAQDIEARLTQFAPADIDFDDAPLEDWERQVLRRLVMASDIIEDIFLEQVSAQNLDWQLRVGDYTGPAAAAIRSYYEIMAGPWDRLEDDAPFLAAGPKPRGAGYYPPDLTVQEFDAWLTDHPDQRAAFTGYFTRIERDGAGGLRAVPYSEAYREPLENAASLLREAAGLSQNASLTSYLNERADAFLSNDYLASDLAWMDIDSRLEPTIGPYEVYEDKLLSYKAAFESFLTVEDAAASAELQRLKDELPALEAALPIPEEYKNPNRAFESPIRVVDVAYTAGDTRAGVQTTAFNLPNDVRVHEQKGSKKVMLRNVARAKFDAILTPIAATLLGSDMAGSIRFDAWFTNVVMHELAHGLGPSTITLASGERTTVNQALRDRYSAFEEAKADVVGLHNLTILAGRGLYDDAFVRAAFAGHAADYFRAIRFGTGEAHGKANLMQLNWMLEKGALRYDVESGTFVADIDAMMSANRELATELLTIQATGSYDAAGEFLERYGVEAGPVEAAKLKLASVPVDIQPRYTIRDKMSSWPGR